jgi:hypothetical protein
MAAASFVGDFLGNVQPGPRRPVLNQIECLVNRIVRANQEICACLGQFVRRSIDKRFIRTNDRIRAREIRVIDDEGKQIGILTPYDALKMAREKTWTW